MRLCLDIYSTSQKAFDTLKKHLILPSKRLIRYYKNAVPLSTAWDPEVMLWAKNEADSLKLTEKDRWCGLIFDEMTIQVSNIFFIILLLNQLCIIQQMPCKQHHKTDIFSGLQKL
jgi:hypothetical protein